MTRTKHFLSAILLGACVSVAMPTAAQANALEGTAVTVGDFMTDLPPSNYGGQLSDFFQGPFYYGNRLGLRGWNSPARAICMTTSGEALGMFAAWRVTTYDYRFVILAILPEAVVTQRVREADAAREQAENDARMARIVAEMDREASWRRSIQPGDESNCGPVVQVNGDMIQVISRQTRDERWYRRSELSPKFYPDGSRYYCR